jgi:hypothetical protein
MHLSGDDSSGSFVSCEDADEEGMDDAAADHHLPAYLPIMCDVDAPTVVIQNTLKLPAISKPVAAQLQAPDVVCDLEAPTVMLQETLSLPIVNPFVDFEEGHEAVAIGLDSCANAPSPSCIYVANRGRSSFLLPLDVDVKLGGISKRRSSCAFALPPLAAVSPDRSVGESYSHENDAIPASSSVIAESPLPEGAVTASPGLSKLVSPSSKRKSLSSQSPGQAIKANTPRRRFSSFSSPAHSQLQTSASDLPIAPLESHSSPVPDECTPLTAPATVLTAVAMPAATLNCENSDPNLSKKTPEKKKRRLYNPARIPDALLEE